MENKITVCVADADQAYRTELCDFLKKQGDICLIGDTADGREALAMVEAQHPAVLVLDTVLPGLDGTGILRRLKGKSETRCIVVTEFRTAEAARDIRDAGAYAFLPKPADDTSVLEHIRQHKTNPRYLRDVHFYTNNLKLSDDINTVVSEADVLILAVPSVYLKTTLEPLTVSLQDKFVISAIKGIVPEDYVTVTAATASRSTNWASSADRATPKRWPSSGSLT